MNIQNSLYSVLGRRKLGVPHYDVTELDGMTKQHYFRCELTVRGINFVAIGTGKGKKNAQEDAAREFGAFLIRNNLIEASDLPILQCQEPEENENICPLFENCAIESQMSTIQSVSPKTEHEALEGNWTLDNCLKTLHEFCQKIRHPLPEYKIANSFKSQTSGFTCKASVFVPTANWRVHGKGSGSNKQMAKINCALSILRQLRHLGILSSAGNIISASEMSEEPIATIHCIFGQSNEENEDEVKVRLCLDLILEVLCWGDRLNLTLLEKIGRRLHLLIDMCFKEAPFHRLDLNFQPCNLILLSGEEVSQTDLTGIPAFVRFNTVEIDYLSGSGLFNDRYEWIQMQLQPIKHNLHGSKMEFKCRIWPEGDCNKQLLKSKR